MTRLEELLENCRASGLRKTQALTAVLSAMLDFELPFSMTDLEKSEPLQATCDRTTIFRTIQRLEGIGLLRRLSFSEEKAAKFSLRHGEKHQEYLICRTCGEVQILDMGCPVHSLQDKIADSSGFTAMSHELTFYGICPSCA